MCRTALTLILGSVLSGCSSSGPKGGQAQESDAQVAERIKALIPEASSVSIAEWQRITDSAGHIGKLEDMPNQSLSLVISMISVPKCKETLWVDGEGGTANPRVLADAMEKSKEKGYATLLQPEFITECKCSVANDKAEGTVTFRVKGLFGGKVDFTARQKDGAWSIEEFRLPGCELRTQRGANGRWKMSKM